jgi:inosine-uridine nucleoside N-ribohydrolase
MSKSEFNFSIDPHAASIVMQSGAAISMIGLDITQRVTVADRIFDALEGHAGKMIVAVRKMLACCRVNDAALHDACVIAALIDPSIFKFANAMIDVEWRDVDRSGYCAVDLVDAPASTRIATDINVPAVANLVVERLVRHCDL